MQQNFTETTGLNQSLPMEIEQDREETRDRTRSLKGKRVSIELKNHQAKKLKLAMRIHTSVAL